MRFHWIVLAAQKAGNRPFLELAREVQLLTYQMVGQPIPLAGPVVEVRATVPTVKATR